MESLLSRVLRAQSLTSTLLVPPNGSFVLEGLVRVARKRNCSLLAGASSGGQQLVGALVFQSAGELRPWQLGDQGSILVVDGVVVAASGIERTMCLLRGVTKARVFGAAVSNFELTDRISHRDVDVIWMPDPIETDESAA